MTRATLVAGVPILLFWAAMTGLLVRREALPAGDLDAAARTGASEQTDTWLALYAGSPKSGDRVGYMHLQRLAERREGRDGETLRATVALRTRLFDRDATLDVAGWGWRELVGGDASFDFRVSAGGSDFRVRGEVEDGRLRATAESAGERVPIDLPVPEELSFSNALGGALTLPDLEPGERTTVAAFDPVTMGVGRTEVRCVARETLRLDGEVVRTRVLEVTTSGLRSRAWVDDRNEVVQAETPVGLSLRRVGAAEALRVGANGGGRGNAGADLLAVTAVRPTGIRPRRGAEGMVVTLGGSPLAAELPTGDMQRRLPAPPGESEARFEIARVSSAPAPSNERTPSSDDLAADAFVQAAHPRIRATAAEILEQAGESDWERATALTDWVYENVEKVPMLGIPSALDVLEQRRGDCNEHTVLFTALARAAGIPTRIAIGLVWSEDLEGFYYHAWPEVFTDGVWTWTDPTLGQHVADATHLELLEGGVESWPQLLPFLGKLEVHVEKVW